MIRRSAACLCQEVAARGDLAAVKALRARTDCFMYAGKPHLISLRPVLRQLEKAGYQLGMMCYLHCMLIEIRRHKYEAALDYHEKFLDTGVAPTQRSQALLLNAYSCLGNAKECKNVLKRSKEWNIGIGIVEINMLLKSMLAANDPQRFALKRDLLDNKLKSLNRHTWPLLVQTSKSMEDMYSTLAYMKSRTTLRIGVRPLAIFHAVCEVCQREGTKASVGFAEKLFAKLEKQFKVGPGERMALCRVAAAAKDWKVAYRTLAVIADRSNLTPNLMHSIVEVHRDAIQCNNNGGEGYLSRVGNHLWVSLVMAFWKLSSRRAFEQTWLLVFDVLDAVDDRRNVQNVFNFAKRWDKDTPALCAAYSAIVTKPCKNEAAPWSPFFSPPPELAGLK